MPETSEKPRATEKAVPYPDFVGKTYVLPDYYEIGREQVRAFAKAVRNFDPIHHDEDAARKAGFSSLVAPPTFASIIGLLMQERLFEHIVKDYDLSQTVQAEQRFSFKRPICAGERLECSVTMLNMRQAVGVDIVETENIGKIWGTEEVVLIGYTKVAGYTGAVMEESLKELVRDVMMHGRSIF